MYATVYIDDSRVAHDALDRYARAYYRQPLDVMSSIQAYCGGSAHECAEWLARYVEAGAPPHPAHFGALDLIRGCWPSTCRLRCVRSGSPGECRIAHASIDGHAPHVHSSPSRSRRWSSAQISELGLREARAAGWLGVSSSISTAMSSSAKPAALHSRITRSRAQHRLLVSALPTHAARGREQTELFVIAQRGSRDTGPTGHLPMVNRVLTVNSA